MVPLSPLCISLVRMLFDNVGDDCDNVDDHDSDCGGGDGVWTKCQPDKMPT